ncbi:uncharacterized protein LOC127367995 isoform X2 [Dicentrarchus labrax]|uniref:uncharacterized protein LOC127367995 isoform X2 n=1 Tax=Dicentrarchus labrax TaxID=13489 RepID=UPI0021F5FFE6|nr:uncharacterized protein LOC127367995 isoform X2 [Dicentrarchus labrax]
MVEFRWIKMSLFLMLVLHFTAAATGQLYLSFTVRAGDDVTLSCENVIKDQNNCDSTIWLFIGSRSTATVELVTLGQIGKNTNSKSDRLSVTANCSLVIKKVTVEDAGRYVCRQFISGQQQGPDSVVDLSVITMTEHKDSDKVTLSCSVSTNGRCTHTVKWLYKGQDLGKDNQEVKTSQSPCNVSVTFKASHYIYTSNSNSLKCAVTDGNKVQQFPFRLQPSAEKPARTDWSVLNYIMLVMRVAELLLITVITVLLIRARGNQRPPDDSTVLNSEGSRAVRRSGPAASQVNNDEDEDDGVVKYENFGETSASVRLH